MLYRIINEQKFFSVLENNLKFKHITYKKTNVRATILQVRNKRYIAYNADDAT